MSYLRSFLVDKIDSVLSIW